MFVAFPWIAGFTNTIIKEMARDPTETTVLVRDAHGDLIEKTPGDLMSEADAPPPEPYVAVGGYLITAVRHLTESERNQFESAFEWAARLVLSRGSCLFLPRELSGTAADAYIERYLLATAEEPAQ